MMDNPNKKKMTIPDFKKFKEEGRKFSFVTAYDYTIASIVNDSDVEIILVGDSLGMIMLGYNSTVPVTMEDMIHHGAAVAHGGKHRDGGWIDLLIDLLNTQRLAVRFAVAELDLVGVGQAFDGRFAVV